MAKIAIDAGHGLKTAGKRCLKKLDANETREWVINDRVADALATYLKSAGHTVKRVDDTDGSTDVSLANRVKAANNWPADFLISVHHNAGVKGGSGGGTVVYTCKSCQEKSTKAQKAIYKNAIARGNLKGNRSNGMPAKNFYMVKKTKMPACLIECGFMDSSTDIKYILDPAWSEKIALGIAEGICEVFGGEVKTSSASGTVSEAPTTSGTEYYRVRIDWNKPSSQIGAYKNLEYAKDAADKHVGYGEYKVYDSKGNVVYNPAVAKEDTPFKVKVTASCLTIRKGAGVAYDHVGYIKDKGVYTIVETAKATDGGLWGKLKSGAGWIRISPVYVDKL